MNVRNPYVFPSNHGLEDKGMTLRDHFVIAALPIAREMLLQYAENPKEISIIALAEEAYEIADILLNERQKWD